MDRIGWYMYNHENSGALRREHQARPGGRDVAHAAVAKAAKLAGRDAPDEPNATGIAVHYAFGILPGALYAAARKSVPALRTGNGALYGVALFILLDETIAPALGIASGPTRYPWQAHLRGLVAHLALGVATETVLKSGDRRRNSKATVN
ncbi:DUF1440 domain-containing protein [Arthrobacter sp. NamB2]|uniref:DUF1440 domain-containing protein n=1 Tax=Arthrobacter sp. NamB2 TaxID=2576035 RepID=UPI00167372B1|nr:DUF1440 domain-containing protein [Arthrobacter sp. NamB2]